MAGKKQHFIPQHFQKPFVIPGSRDRLWMFRRGKPSGLNVTRKKAAAQGILLLQAVARWVANTRRFGNRILMGGAVSEAAREFLNHEPEEDKSNRTTISGESSMGRHISRRRIEFFGQFKGLRRPSVCKVCRRKA